MDGERLAIRVVKSNGQFEDFRPEKILRTLRRAGASRELAEKIAKKIEAAAYDGITTKEILSLVKETISRRKLPVAMRYGLKEAIMRLGPAGFAFENFVAELLKHYGYDTKLRSVVNGKCVQHEVDVIAEKSNGDFIRAMIECKFHNLPGNAVGLKDVLYTYARFLDLKEAAEEGKGKCFDEVWLISNTKASSDAKRYADCRGMRLICWRCPAGHGLEKMIEWKKLYPVTVLRSVDKGTLEKLAQVGIILVKQLSGLGPDQLSGTGLGKKRLKSLFSEAEQLLFEKT
ncbi:MAG: ATP cone domain-containing protein [Candidatus Hadarchaeaceae archaeon]